MTVMTMFPVMAVFPVHDYSDASVSIDDSVATLVSRLISAQKVNIILLFILSHPVHWQYNSTNQNQIITRDCY